MILNGKEYSKEFLEQLLIDASEIAECIDIDIKAKIITEDDCDIIAYTEFSNKYINL